MPKKNTNDADSSLKQQALEEEVKRLNVQLASLSEKIQFKNELHNALKNEVTSVNLRADKLEQSLQLKSRQIDDLHNRLFEKQTLLDDFQKSMIDRMAQLNNLQENVQNTNDANLQDSSVEERQQLQEKINLAETKLKSMQEEMQQEQSNFTQKEKMYADSLEQMTNTVHDKNNSLDETIGQLNDTKLLIDTLQSELKSNNSELIKSVSLQSALEKTLSNKDTEILNIRKGLTSWIEKAKLQNLTIQTKESELIVLRSELKAQERELQRLRSRTPQNSPQQQPPKSEQQKKSPYEILGVPLNASFDEIKKAHRQAVKKYNPHIVETLGDDVKELVIETAKEINLAFSWFKKKYDVC